MTDRDDLPSPFEEYASSRDAIVAAALDCIITIDAAGCVVEFNPAAERVFGHARHEILGKELAEIILPPEHRGAHRAGMKRFQSERTSRIIGKRLHLEALRSSGERFPIELTVTAYKNPEGEPEYTAYLRDRTEHEDDRRRREEAAAQLRQVTEHVDGVIALIEWPSARLLHMSGKYGYTFQLPDDAFARDTKMWEALVAEEQRHLIAPLVRRDPDIEPIDVEIRRAKRRSWLRLRVNPIRGFEGAIERLLVQTESITSRKEVESKLEQTRFVLERVAEAIFLMGQDGRFVYANRAASRMLGWDQEELIGMSVFQIDSVMRPEVWPQHWAELEKAETLTLESIHRRRDGTEFPVEVTANYAQFGGVPFNCAVVRDISDRREAEAAVEGALQEAQTAQLKREELLSNLGHELRTPLAAAAGMIDLIAEYPSDPVAVNEWARGAAQSCDRLRRTIDSVLAARDDGAPVAYDDLRPVDALELVESVVAERMSDAAARGLALSVTSIGARPSRVLVKPAWLREIIVQLLSNALKFTERGWIEIEFSATPSSLGAHVRIEVRDTGPGMDPTLIEEAFGRFVRLGPNAAGVDEGLGLGLALARASAERGGAQLSIDSRLGRGTSAIIECDVELGPESEWIRSRAAAPAQPPQEGGTLKGKVLVVEDAPELALLYSRWLTRWGLQVETAGTGTLALERLEEEEFDLAIIDWRLPEKDGLEVTRELRERGSFIPIFIITAQDFPGVRERALNAGCSAFLAKPVDRGELLGLMHEYLAAGIPVSGSGSMDSSADDEWRRDLRERFLRSVAGEIQAMGTAIVQEDRVEVQRLAHRLKGGATTFELEELAASARSIEALDLGDGNWRNHALMELQRLVQLSEELD